MAKPEQHVLDEIDSLISESIAVGPVDDYEVNRYVKCAGCHRDWHGLPKPGCTGGDEPAKGASGGDALGMNTYLDDNGVALNIPALIQRGIEGGDVTVQQGDGFVEYTATLRLFSSGGGVLVIPAFREATEGDTLEDNGFQPIGYIDETGLTRGES